MNNNLEVKFSISAEELVDVLSDSSAESVIKLIGELLDLIRDEKLNWKFLVQRLETLVTQYSEESDWYTEKIISGTFEDGKYSSEKTLNSYNNNLKESLDYLNATEKILVDCRHVLSGKPKNVGRPR